MTQSGRNTTSYLKRWSFISKSDLAAKKQVCRNKEDVFDGSRCVRGWGSGGMRERIQG